MADGYSYCPYKSTTALFHNANGSNPEFLNLREDHPLPSLDLDFIPRPFTILSSLSGLILIRGGPSNSYYLFDPLYPPTVGLKRIPDPQPPHPANTPAVIALKDNEKYEIVCAVSDGEGSYFISKFNSYLGLWVPNGDIYLGRRRILVNTGVSWKRHAFWLTEVPQWIVCVDLVTSNIWRVSPPKAIQHGTKLQLGVSGNYPSLVIVDSSVAKLYQLMITENEVYWHRPSIFVNLNRGAEAASVNRHLSDQIVCRDLPQPLRFESKKLEVLFLVDGRRLVLWESRDEPSREMRVVTLAHGLQPENSSDISVADAVPYVISRLPPPAGVWPSTEPVGFSQNWFNVLT